MAELALAGVGGLVIVGTILLCMGTVGRRRAAAMPAPTEPAMGATRAGVS